MKAIRSLLCLKLKKNQDFTPKTTEREVGSADYTFNRKCQCFVQISLNSKIKEINNKSSLSEHVKLSKRILNKKL